MYVHVCIKIIIEFFLWYQQNIILSWNISLYFFGAFFYIVQHSCTFLAKKHRKNSHNSKAQNNKYKFIIFVTHKLNKIVLIPFICQYIYTYTNIKNLIFIVFVYSTDTTLATCADQNIYKYHHLRRV